MPTILMLNKLDDLLLNNDKSLEEIFKSLLRIIDSFKVLVSTFSSDAGVVSGVKSCLGNVVFGSVKYKWAFTLRDFAKYYSKRFGMTQDELVEKLWGDWYFDVENNQWLNHSKENSLERTFCHFILKPIRKILLACENSDLDELSELLNPFGITLHDQIHSKELIKSSMNKWLSASDVLLYSIKNYLPSPKIAQQDRVQQIYTGPLTDKYGDSIKNCDPNGPLMIFISSNKLVHGKFYAVGRIFSGSLQPDTLLRILNSNEVFEEIRIGGIVKFNGSMIESVEEASCELNSIVGLVGIERFLTNKGATITESSELEAKPFCNVKVLNFPMVNIYVDTKQQVNLPKVIRGLDLISKCDSSLSFFLDEETGEKILTVFNESHLNSVLNQFNQLHPSVEITVSEPIVKYRETVTSPSGNISIVKSPNKHNRLYFTAEAAKEDVILSIESETLPEDSTERAKLLNESFGWDLFDARRTWSFANANILVDQTKDVYLMNEIKDATILGFNIATFEGPLCNETMRGIRFNIKDATMHCDGLRRGTGQIAAAAKKVCYASMLDAQPILMEPIFLMEFKCGQIQMGNIYSILNDRRGIVKEQHDFNSLVFGKAYLPVSDAFGVVEFLDKQSISSHLVFDHWQSLTPNSTRLYETVSRIRIRKGLTEQPLTYADLIK